MAAADGPAEIEAAALVAADWESPDSILNELLEVMSALQSNPFDYALHQRNVALCQKLGADTIEELNQARTLMAEYFPVKEDFFTAWVSDQASCQQSPYSQTSVEAILNIYEQASAYALFPKVEAARLEYLINLYYYSRGIPKPTGDLMDVIEESSDDAATIDVDMAGGGGERTQEQIELEKFITEEKVRTLAIDVMDKVGYHLVESSAIWNMWALHDFYTLKRNWNEEGFARFKAMLQSRLRVPHLDSAKTFQIYSTLITKHENDIYEEEMVAVNALYSSARKLTEDREIHEVQLKKTGYSCEEYLKYLSWEISKRPSNFDLAYTLFERAVLDHPNSPDLWLEFLRYMSTHRTQPALSISVAKRATRTVPWSGDVWASAIRIFERNSQVAGAVEDLCARAMQSKFLEHDVEAVVTFTIGRADYHRRRLDAYLAAGGAENVEQVGALIDVVAKALQHGVDVLKKVFPKSGDPSCRLEKYLTALYEHHDREDEASKVWQKATKQYREVYSTWISAADCEVRRGDLTRARDYYKKSANIKLDYPEYLLQAWLTFEHQFGGLDDLEYAMTKTNHIMKGISARRKREAEQQSSAVLQGTQPTHAAIPGGTLGAGGSSSHTPGTDANDQNRKRKLDAVSGGADDVTGDKKSKLSANQPQEVAAEKDGDIAELKRDRENSTVLVAGLKPDITEGQISQLFRDCGKIREIVIHRIDSNDVVATVEFMDRSSVLPAQTKDKKQLNGQEIAVTLAWRSTLYVTNFSEDANDKWVREKFSPYGNIFDVRWPSKRFKSTRRFCYVQFTSAESAEAALALHNLEVSPQQKMSVFISDPARKQARSDVKANDRELYITCLSKFVQESDLRKLFAPFGEIKGIRVVLDEAGHSKGFAFVEFENEMSAQAALSLNNVELKKRRIGVTISSAKGLSLARNKTAFNAETKLSSVTDHRNRSVKVTRLAEGTQEALVQQAFEPFGKVLKTITYPEKNEALVEFELAKDAGKVLLHPDPIVINGQEIELSAPSMAAVKLDSSASSSFSPLLPRSTMRGKKARLGLGHQARVPLKTESTGEQSAKQDSTVQDVQMEDGTPSRSTTATTGKSQDDFRKMLG